LADGYVQTPLPIIARGLPLRLFYLANGIVGSIFTLSLIILPHSTGTFALALFGEFLFQAVSFSVQIGIVFEVIGPDNPLAATTFSFLTAATNIPVTFMMVADGHGYSARGIAGSFGLDASISIGACFLAGLLLLRFDRKMNRRSIANLVDQLQSSSLVVVGHELECRRGRKRTSPAASHRLPYEVE
jgi:hypothetical protein